MSERDSFFINLGTITYVHKAQNLLEQNGIKSKVDKKPSSDRGCSYGVFVKGRKKEEVTMLLRASSIKIL